MSCLNFLSLSPLCPFNPFNTFPVQGHNPIVSPLYTGMGQAGVKGLRVVVLAEGTDREEEWELGILPREIRV